MGAPAALDPKEANARYHDAAAASYEEKWGIALDEASRAYVARRAGRMLPERRYGRVLELGCGTGFWLLNLWRSGYVDEAHATDISDGMLAACEANAAGIGCPVALRRSDAEQLPYEDGSFDLVTGHAFLHHLPDPRGALVEVYRVLAPGGVLFFAGEPTRAGDRLATAGKRAVVRAMKVSSNLPGLRSLRRPPTPQPTSEEERILRDLEFAVDLHTFEPAEVASWASEAGFVGVRTETEELVSSVVGWAIRTLESEVRPGLLGRRWGRFAFETYRVLYRLDEVLYRVVPKRLFYNLLLYSQKPERG